MSFILFMQGMAFTIVASTLPDMLIRFDVNLEEMSRALVASNIGGMFGGPFGILLDRFHRQVRKSYNYLICIVSCISKNNICNLDSLGLILRVFVILQGDLIMGLMLMFNSVIVTLKPRIPSLIVLVLFNFLDGFMWTAVNSGMWTCGVNY